MARMSLSRISSLFATLVFVIAIAFAPASAYADSSSRIITLGADLTDEQRETVLSFFGLTEGDLDDMEVIEVTNTDERSYLEGVLSDDIIGYRTMSCSYIQITSSGGINVETANLSYVTKNTIYNALQTAGIENCNVVVTAPYEVSGTGALTGIFMAFESSGTTLDEEKKEAATEELVATAELEETYGSEVAEVISEVKNEAISSDSDLSEDEISELVEETASDYGLSLSTGDVQIIVNLIVNLQELDYDSDAFASTLSDALAGLSESSSGIWGSIKSFFSGIVDFFVNLFNSLTGSESSSDSDSIFDDLDTDVYELDETTSSEESDTSTTEDAEEDTAEEAATEATEVEDAEAIDDSSSDSSGSETASDSSDADSSDADDSTAAGDAS